MNMIDSPLPAALALDEEPFDLGAIDVLAAENDGEEGYQAPAEENPARHWRIEDYGAAEWALRHLAEGRAQQQQIAGQVQEWRWRLDAWHEERMAPLVRREQYFVALLEDYALRVREASASAIKTVVLPSGKVKTTERKPKVDVGDYEAFQAWAPEHTDDPMVLGATWKASVSGIKERAKIWEEAVGMRWTIRLDCTHVATGVKMFESGESEQDPPKVGESWGCHDCADPIAGPAQSRVDSVESEEVTELVARDIDTGEIIPWAKVVPGSVTAKVSVE